MKALYFDCFSGISGDMCLGALLDLGVVDAEAFVRQMSKLGLNEYTLNITKTKKHNFSATDVDVMVHNHEGCGGHGDGHAEEHGHCPHSHAHGRGLSDIFSIIDRSGISARAKKMAKDIFFVIARAEAKVHQQSIDQVHFHEVGAVDSIVDIVGTAVLIDMLGVERIFCSELSEGRGFVRCQHGLIPVPVPATAQILAEVGAPVKRVDIQTELVTPTGAGIVAALASGFGEMPRLAGAKIGYGAGKKDLATPNLLRVYYGELKNDVCKGPGRGAASRVCTNEDTVVVIETNIDDMTAQNAGFVMEELFCKGALDVFFTPIVMKKNRPALKLSVLCAPGKGADMEDIIFTHTSTIGIRKYMASRCILEREVLQVDTEWGKIDVKASYYGNLVKYMPEYESVAKAARAQGVSFDRVYTDARAACLRLMDTKKSKK